MMKLLIETDAYASCNLCEEGAKPGDPLIKFGQFVEWVVLHKSCFDKLVKEAESLFEEWTAKTGK